MQKGFNLIPLILIILVFVAAIFIPIPYYQKDTVCILIYPTECKSGWQLGQPLWKRIFQSNTQQTISSPQPTPTPSTTPDETANWKTYTNNKYSFSFKYPSSFSLTTRNTNKLIVILEDSKGEFDLISEPYSDNFKNSHPNKTVTINNIKWDVFSSAGSCDGLTACPQIIPYYRTIRNNLIYDFTFGLREEDLTPILNTFKFLE